MAGYGMDYRNMARLALWLMIIVSKVDGSIVGGQIVDGTIINGQIGNDFPPEENMLLLYDFDDIGGGFVGPGGLSALAVKKLGLLALILFALPVPGPNGIIITAGQSMVMNVMNTQSNPPIFINPGLASVPCMQTACPPDFLELVNGNCYYLSGINEGRRRWTQARDDCLMRMGNLWEPDTQMEVDAVAMLFNLGSDRIWVGANDGQSEGTARFFPSMNILGGFLDGPGICQNIQTKDCVAVERQGGSIVWCFDECSDANRYICEIERTTCV